MSGSSSTSSTAEGIGFDMRRSRCPRRADRLHVTNKDTALHNMAIYGGQDASANEARFMSPDVDGGAEATFTIDPLKKGEYTSIATTTHRSRARWEREFRPSRSPRRSLPRGCIPDSRSGLGSDSEGVGGVLGQ